MCADLGPSFNFDFKRSDGSTASPAVWLDEWSPKSIKYTDEAYYNYLEQKASKMTDRDILILGAWKDGALVQKGDPFDPEVPEFTRKWGPNAASVAYQVWKNAAKELGGKMAEGFPTDTVAFIRDWSERTYPQEMKGGVRSKHFGLARATTLPHFVSGGRYPIFDSRVRKAVRNLTGVAAPYTLEWYLGTYCELFLQLTKECNSEPNPRKVDNAVRAYSKFGEETKQTS
jgi:hypothetical protein